MEDDNHATRLRFCRRPGSHLKYIHADSDENRPPKQKGKGTGLKISTKKTKVMRINVNNNNVAVIDGEEVQDVDSFDYLGARITKHEGPSTTSRTA